VDFFNIQRSTTAVTFSVRKQLPGKYALWYHALRCVTVYTCSTVKPYNGSDVPTCNSMCGIDMPTCTDTLFYSSGTMLARWLLWYQKKLMQILVRTKIVFFGESQSLQPLSHRCSNCSCCIMINSSSSVAWPVTECCQCHHTSPEHWLPPGWVDSDVGWLYISIQTLSHMVYRYPWGLLEWHSGQSNTLITHQICLCQTPNKVEPFPLNNSRNWRTTGSLPDSSIEC